MAELSWTPKGKGKHLPAYRLHTHFEVLSGKAVRIDATSASPKGCADERAVLQRTIEADRCYILDCGYISYRLWNAINVAGSSYVCRSSDRTLATVTQANELTDADRAASGAATISSIRGVRCCADGGRRARLIREGKARGYPCR